jgi:chromosome partitioning protein
LMPLAMESHKPMFYLKPADGAIGAHVSAVRDCYDDFHALAQKIAAGIGLELG